MAPYKNILHHNIIFYVHNFVLSMNFLPVYDIDFI